MPECLSHEELERLARVAEEAAPAAGREHLAACADCRRELDGVRRNLDLFEQCLTLGEHLVGPAQCEEGRGPSQAHATGRWPRSGLVPAEIEPLADVPWIDGYRIVREIHRGAQGVVYEAIQQSANRVVALKVLLAGPFATLRQRHRFEREIEFVASLEHPHIVRLYDSGQAGAHHYFAMEFVDGMPLCDFVALHRPSLRDTLRLFADVCGAVAYAHQRGVIHRDLKPGNILVDKAGRPHVVDFGLAKPASMSPAGADSLATQTGEFLGTLAYASPEQVSGSPDRIDTRTDVYALGVILYELLARRGPYPTDGPISQVVRSIAETAPLKPSRHDRRLDDELDTIALKALAKAPERRYPSVDALAADIQRYLAGRPIEAKSDSGWYVLKKNLVRYRAVVAVAAAFAVTVSAGLVVSLWQWRAARWNTAAAEVNARAAEANFARARNAVDQMLTAAADESLAKIPQTEALRRALLEKALTFYEGFLEENSADPAIRFEAGQAYCRLGRCAAEMGQFQQAHGLYGQAIAILEALSAEYPATPEYREALAGLWNYLGGNLRQTLQRPQEGGAAHRAALELYGKLAADFPGVPTYRAKLAESLVNVAHVLRGAYRLEEAEGEYRRALAIREAFAAESPSDPAPLAASRQWLGELLVQMHRMPEAEAHLRAAVLVYEQLFASSPGDAARRAALARRQMGLGELLFRTRRFVEAEELFRQAITHEEKLMADFPGVRQYLHHLSLAYQSLGQGLLLAGQFDKATEALRQVLRLCQMQALRFPESAEEGTLLAWAHYNLGVALHRAGQRDQAAEEFQKAFSLLEWKMETPGSVQAIRLSQPGRPPKQRRALPKAP